MVIGALPDNASSRAQKNEAATTETHAASEAPKTTPPRFGITELLNLMIGYTHVVPINAMFTILAPSVVRPPSWKTKHWTMRTTVITIKPAHGPSNVAAIAPPRR
jgi:hypothetical protein